MGKVANAIHVTSFLNSSFFNLWWFGLVVGDGGISFFSWVRVQLHLTACLLHSIILQPNQDKSIKDKERQLTASFLFFLLTVLLLSLMTCQESETCTVSSSIVSYGINCLLSSHLNSFVLSSFRSLYLLDI